MASYDIISLNTDVPGEIKRLQGVTPSDTGIIKGALHVGKAISTDDPAGTRDNLGLGPLSVITNPTASQIETLRPDLATASTSLGAWLVRYLQAGANAVARWSGDKLQERVSAEDFGAVGNGTTNDRLFLTRLNTAIVGSAKVGPGYCTKQYLIDDSDLTINNRAQLKGERVSHDSTDRAGWMNCGSTLILNPLYKLRMQNGSSISGLILRRKGLDTGTVTAAQVAQYSGTAIEIVSAAQVIENMTILGFETGILSPETSNSARVTFSDIEIDSINGIDYAFDLGGPKFFRVRCEPILTSPPDINNERPGFGIRLRDQVDNATLIDCFMFQKDGFIFDSVNGTVTESCFSDGPRTVSNGTGMQIIGDSTEHRHNAFSCASHDTGVLMNATGTTVRRAFFENLGLWQLNSYGIRCLAGAVYSNGGFIARLPANYPGGPAPGPGVAIQADGPGAVVYVDNMRIGNTQIALQAINGGVIYYGDGMVFENNALNFQGDCRPMRPPARTYRSALKPILLPETGTISGSSTAVAVANQLKFYPIQLPIGYTIDRIAFEVTTADSSNARMAIYSNDEQAGGPGALLFESADVDCSSTGEKEASVSPSLVGPRRVWAAINFSGTPAVRSMSVGNLLLGANTRVMQTSGYNLPQTYGAMPVSVSASSLASTGTLISVSLYKV